MHFPGTPVSLTDATAPDFSTLLQRQGLYPKPAEVHAGTSLVPTHATTILAFKYADGVLVAGDRRATAGNALRYARAEQVLESDRFSLMAIAGVPATAWEMARVLEHSFHFYRRSQLAEMSIEGKVRALSKLLRDNLGFVLQGVGVVVPIFATYDAAANAPRVYFYDAMGAGFEAAEYTATGSGSPAVKAVLHFENTYGRRPLKKLKPSEATLLALRALDTAAESDAATGGVDRRAKIFPIVKLITERGIETLSEARLARLYRGNLASA